MTKSLQSRRQGEIGKKTLTPPAPKPKPVPQPHVRKGDILLLSNHYGWNPLLGVVVEVASGKGGEHKVVNEEGREWRISKPSASGNILFRGAYEDRITVVGHDEEWLKLEEGLAKKRRGFAAKHRAAARTATEQIKRQKAEEAA